MFRYVFALILMQSLGAQAKEAQPITSTITPTSPSTPAVSPAQPTSALKKPAANTVRTAQRRVLVFDYNSWFQNILILGGTPYETKALIYGLGLTYESNYFRATWGWGFGGGLIHGSAVTGDSSDSTSYYAKRVQIENARISSRIFRRINPRLDIGLLASLLYTISNWPTSNGLTVAPPSGIMAGAFLDTRWRLDGHWELVQALGTYNRGPSLAWRLGTTYSF